MKRRFATKALHIRIIIIIIIIIIELTQVKLYWKILLK